MIACSVLYDYSYYSRKICIINRPRLLAVRVLGGYECAGPNRFSQMLGVLGLIIFAAIDHNLVIN